MIERFIFTLSFSHKKKWRSKKHTADVVIERIYFYSFNFSQKEIRSKKHMADVVVPAMM